MKRLNRFSIYSIPLVFSSFFSTHRSIVSVQLRSFLSEIDWAHFRLLCVFVCTSFILCSNFFSSSSSFCFSQWQLIWLCAYVYKCVMHVNERNIKRFNLIIRIVSDLCWSKDIYTYDSSIIIHTLYTWHWFH